MTPLQEKLRAALRDTADEIPAEAPPPRLNPRERVRGDPHPGRRWTAWAAPLTAAALIVAVVFVSLGVARSMHDVQSAAASAGGGSLPPYYVALTTQKANSDIYSLGATAAEVRSTATGQVLAKVSPPAPYISFTGVTGAADDRTFVLSAQGPDEMGNLSARQYHQKYPNGYYEAQRFFLLRINPAASPGARMSLTALPASWTPANQAIHDMALSPDGTTLAADVGTPLFSSQLYLFNLATGTERAWSARTCSACMPGSGGMDYGGVNVDSVSWTADSQHVAFIWGATVRLLDTRAAGSNILTDSKRVAAWAPGPNALDMWRGAIITPDAGTVLGIEELPSAGRLTSLREQLVQFSTATGKQTAVLNDLNVLKLNGYEQVLYTNADGSVLVLTFQRPGKNATIVRDGRPTPLPWSPYIGVAAW
jgi:hypothetical protein